MTPARLIPRWLRQPRYDFRIAKYTSIYVVISCLWILFSDKIVAATDPSTFQILSTAKGWLFVAVTATLLHAMMVRNTRRIVATEAAHTVLFNHAADSILITDAAGRFTDVNMNAAELLGYSRNELLKLGFEDIVAPEDLARDSLGDHELSEGKSAVIERRYVRKDGSIVPIESNATTLPERKHLAIVRDITKRKLMEDALLQSEKQNRAIVNAVPDLLFRISSEGILLEYRTNDESQLYMPPVTFLGKKIDAVLPAEVAALAREAIQRALRSGTVESFEYSLTIEGQVKFFENRVVSLSDSEVLFVIRNITDRRMAEEERKKLENQLLRAQKIESLGTLAAGIAHDFNNILNIIMGNASLLMARDENVEKTQNRIRAITEASDRGAQLVKQLLAFARKTEIRQQSLSLNNLIRDASKLLEETFPKTVSLAYEFEPNLPPVIADPNQLHQVLLNFSVNARDAMPSGGRLTFKTRLASAEEIQRRFPQAPPKAHVAFTVADNGTGMDDETRLRVFEPFFTTKEVGKGTGLGLAVVLGIIQSHNGFIDVSSESGIGSRFTVYLPASEEHKKDDAELGSSGIKKLGNNEVILLIDDEKLALEATAEYLTEGGFTVLTAGDAEQGLDLYLRHANEILLVMSDYGLPKYNGEEFFARFRQISPSVPFILLTGFLETQARERMLAKGVNAIITKPYKPSDLMAKMRAVIDKKDPG
jgi:PAS domain S-box-containing protein